MPFSLQSLTRIPPSRELAVNYFTAAFSLDPRVMPAFIEAVEKYGWENHEDQLRSLSNVIQTEETVRWLLDQFVLSEGDDARQDDIACVLVHAPAAVLKKFDDAIASSLTLPDDLKAALQDSIALLALPPEELWKRLEDDCGPLDLGTISASPPESAPELDEDEPDEEFDDEDFDDDDLAALEGLETGHDHLKGLAAALGAYPEFVAERVRTVLRNAVNANAAIVATTRIRCPHRTARTPHGCRSGTGRVADVRQGISERGSTGYARSSRFRCGNRVGLRKVGGNENRLPPNDGGHLRGDAHGSKR